MWFVAAVIVGFGGDTSNDCSTEFLYLGAQILGASAGNMVSVVNVVAAAAVVGRVGREGEIIRVTLVPMLAYTAAVGLVAAAAIGFAR